MSEEISSTNGGKLRPGRIWWIVVPGLILVAFCPKFSGRAAESGPQELEFFEKKIRPVLVEHCYKCHSSRAKKPKGKFLLDSREHLLKGGESGPAVVPGHPENSRLIEAIRYADPDLQMPPRGKLPDPIIADLARWIKMGLPWPGNGGTKTASEKYSFNLQKRKREHWAWQPIRSSDPPPVKTQGWVRDPLDHFILARLEEKGLQPASPANRRTWIRRVYFDLIGLPPTTDEVEAFVRDSSDRAHEKVVDRLLASPHFGERWGRHWLDLVRYGETRGHEFDYPNPNAYQYRDYVIRAFNADVPYNQFVVEHLAGDLLEKPRLNQAAGFNESILGTGFWFLGEQVHSPVDVCQDKADRFDNMLDVMGKTFLGLTVACARCHDHKFDAISAKDYYSLFGFLESSSYRLVRFDTLEQNRQAAHKLWELRERVRPRAMQALAKSVEPGIGRLADYLLAVRETSTENVAEIAKKYRLDPILLERWFKAGLEKTEIFQPWVVASKSGGEGLRALVDNWGKRDALAGLALKGTEVIVDYSRPGPDGWLPDGFVFGPGPTRPGDVVLEGDPKKPGLHFQDFTAAVLDPAWKGLKLAPGTENDPGSLGRDVRAGRTIRTPSFEIKNGKVFYLVKGSGMAYAAVDGHVMIAGPLHGQLVMPFRTGPDFQWLAHDLKPYKGRRAHIEFTPARGSDFALALVVQADATPGDPRSPNQLLLRLLSNGKVDSPSSLAAGYQSLMGEAVKRLAAGDLGKSPEVADYARLANWLARHVDLFQPDANKTPLGKTARALIAEQAALVAGIKTESRLALAILDGSGVNERVYIRGSYKTPGEIVPRRFLEALTGAETLRVSHGSGRLELARQMIDPAIDPFLPRVLVNRLWQHLMGRGIVPSVDNFGVLGQKPTHPELLDYLADRFVKEGWSIKKMIRALALSGTYRMSSHSNGQGKEVDPENRLWHHMPMRRLEGEVIRDAMLAVSGRLDGKMFGPAVPVYLTPFQEGRGRPASGPLDGNGRRSLYLAVRRNFLPAMLLAFDTPIPFSTVGQRTVSNVPAQALILLNDPFVHQQAEVWAKKELAKIGTSRDRITRMYQSAFGRSPGPTELSACLDFLNQQKGQPELAAWSGLAHVLFNAKEFIFVE